MRKLGVVVAASAAVVGMGAAARDRHNDNDVLKNPPATTIVEAQEGDTISGLQSAEGPRPGLSLGETIQDAVTLNGDSRIMPGDEVVLVDNPNNNPEG